MRADLLHIADYVVDRQVSHHVNVTLNQYTYKYDIF